MQFYIFWVFLINFKSVKRLFVCLSAFSWIGKIGFWFLNFFFLLLLLKGITKLIVLFDFRKFATLLWWIQAWYTAGDSLNREHYFQFQIFQWFKFFFFAFKLLSGIKCVTAFGCKWWHYDLNFVQTRTCWDLCCLGTCCSCSMISKGQNL